MTSSSSHAAPQRIPVEVAATSPHDARIDATAAALLHEIVVRLKALRDTAAGGCIDLRRTPLSPRTRDDLATVLGEGEVTATVQALGSTHLRETAIPGVWWITHHDAHGNVAGELIEIAVCPELLATPPEELHVAQERLRVRLDEHLHARQPAPGVAERVARLGLVGAAPGMDGSSPHAQHTGVNRNA